jgi:hypothetical protein
MVQVSTKHGVKHVRTMYNVEVIGTKARKSADVKVAAIFIRCEEDKYTFFLSFFLYTWISCKGCWDLNKGLKTRRQHLEAAAIGTHWARHENLITS